MKTPPGDTLKELLEEHGLSQAEFAKKINRPLKTINEIIKGKTRITEQTAIQLEEYFKVPAEFWLEREYRYRLSLIRKLNHCKHKYGKAHTCPFEEDVEENGEIFCTCCKKCTYECAMSI